MTGGWLVKRSVTLLTMALLFSVLPQNYAAEREPLRQEAEQWEEVAKLRIQAASGHEVQAERKRDQAFRLVGNFMAAGDALDIAGDEKYLASEAYQIANKQWEKAAKAFKAAADPDQANDALEKAAAAWSAAKRTLREGADLYKMAEDQFENLGELDKKIKVIEKSARNIERLMEMR